MNHTYDIHVRGRGIVSRCLALSLARLGLRVALSAQQDDLTLSGRLAQSDRSGGTADVRAFALNAASQQLLAALKVWDGAVQDATTPVYDMWIQTQARQEGAPAEVALAFSAWQQKVGELAWIVEAAPLSSELESAVRFSPQISLVSNAEKVNAPLTAICEGRFSSTREELGVQFDERSYGQTAIAARLQSADPHQGMAQQWFLSPEVLALLPCGRTSGYALVWSVPHERAQALLALSEADFLAELSQITRGRVGELTFGRPHQSALDRSSGDQRQHSPRAAWPLVLGQAQSWCGVFPSYPTQSWVLLGDAAHAIHPLAGQGLNLGLTDVSALITVLSQREPWRPLSDTKLLRRYERERLGPTWAMQRATDGLLHLFAHPSETVKTLRESGLAWLNRATPLKRWLAKQAAGF